MPTFTLAGVTYDYLTPKAPGQGVQSWEYGHWPRVNAAVPLTDGSTAAVYGEAMRWSPENVSVRWRDDEGHFHMAWIPKANIRPLTASEWDIIEYHQAPENLRHIQWGKRLPGFLPE